VGIGALVYRGVFGRIPPASDVPGVYKLDYRQYNKLLGTEILTLRRDGNYTQSFTLPGGKTYANSGTWEFDEPDKGIYGKFDRPIHLEGYKEYVGYFGEMNLDPPPTGVFTGVDRDLGGRIHIAVNDDEGWSFIKQRQPVPSR
jgi:hypothetical protein